MDDDIVNLEDGRRVVANRLSDNSCRTSRPAEGFRNSFDGVAYDDCSVHWFNGDVTDAAELKIPC
jgi:hypothetical protein